MVKDDESVTVRVGRKSIRCKKSLLSAKSEYFSAMFSSQMSECFTDTVRLKEVDPDALKVLVRFCETGNLKIDIDNVLAVTEAASMLQFKGVVSSCCKFVIEKLLNDNSCLMLMSFAELHSIDELYNVAMQLSLWYVKKVIKSEDFLRLNQDQLHKLLKRKELNNVDQTQMVNAIKVWVNHDSDSRLQYLSSLLRCFNCEYLDEDQLNDLSDDEESGLEGSSSNMAYSSLEHVRFCLFYLYFFILIVVMGLHSDSISTHVEPLQNRPYWYG